MSVGGSAVIHTQAKATACGELRNSSLLSTVLLFCGAKNLPSAEKEAAEAASAAADTADFQFDTVTVEIERYAYLSPEALQPFLTPDGMLNHFKMFWQLRDCFLVCMV